MNKLAFAAAAASMLIGFSALAQTGSRVGIVGAEAIDAKWLAAKMVWTQVKTLPAGTTCKLFPNMKVRELARDVGAAKDVIVEVQWGMANFKPGTCGIKKNAVVISASVFDGLVANYAKVQADEAAKKAAKGKSSVIGKP